MQSAYSGQADNHREEFRKIFRRSPHAFALNEFETQQLKSLLSRGYAFAPGFFSQALVDHIHAKADAIFRNVPKPAEHRIELEDPLVQISEVLDIAFHEGVLKVVAHFFRHIPPLYRVAIVRYFPREGAPYLSGFRQETHDSDSLGILVDLGRLSTSQDQTFMARAAHAS